MWRELIASHDEGAEYGEPASQSEIANAVRILGHTLPGVLVECLMEANGIWTDYGLGRLVWPVAQIVETNSYYRASPDYSLDDRPLDSLLFFGDPGTGDPYAFEVEPRRDDIYQWFVLDSAVERVAPNFGAYVTLCLEDRP